MAGRELIGPTPIGQGRTCDVWDVGDGRVVRRYRDGRDATREGLAMRRLAEAGAPVPAVHTIDGPELVMDRVDGPTLLEHLVARRDVVNAAALLRDLLAAVAAVVPPDGLPEPFGPGEATLHLDLHPGNVILAANGPVIIDWDNVSRGPAAADVAQSWMLVVCGDIPGPSRLERHRDALADALLPDGDPATAWRTPVLRRRLNDANTTPSEALRIHRLLTDLAGTHRA